MDTELPSQIAAFVQPRFEAAMRGIDKASRSAALSLVQEELVQTLGKQYPERLKDIITFY